MMLPINAISENPRNARAIKASPEADEALRTSIASIGLLQPVLVAPDVIQRDQWTLLAGHRRLAACRELGWITIEANTASLGIEGVSEIAISAAENMVRAGMHPVDQWRAIRDLREASGYNLETAAAVLGINLPMARRMEILGKMAPEILEEIALGDLPPMAALRTIAMAPIEKQREALIATRGENPAKGALDFYAVSALCRIRRMPMSRAIFDTNLMGWDEDMFDQPEADTRFTTTDIAEFMNQQRKALAEKATKSKGRMEIITDPDGKLPKGWVRDYSGPPPKRFAKDDPRRVFALLHEADDYRQGEVDYIVAHRVEPSSQDAASSASVESIRAAPINKKTLERLASMKYDALARQLQIFKQGGAKDMLRALLMIFTYRNVRAGTFLASPYNGLARALVTPSGDPNIEVSEEELCNMALWVIEDATCFDHPNTTNGSGPGAEWLAVAIGATMPRTDTKEVLRGVSQEHLEDVVKSQGIQFKKTPTKPANLRKALTDAMPDFRFADFGATGPMPIIETGEVA